VVEPRIASLLVLSIGLENAEVELAVEFAFIAIGATGSQVMQCGSQNSEYPLLVSLPQWQIGD
jgi:hypothetical protein